MKQKSLLEVYREGNRWCSPRAEALVKQLLWAKKRLKMETITRRRIAAVVGLARGTVDSIATETIGKKKRHRPFRFSIGNRIKTVSMSMGTPPPEEEPAR